MNDHSYHGGHRSITQGDSASHGFDPSFTNPGANNMRTQVPDLAVAKVSYQFHDFINPQSGDPDAPIWVKGSIPSLDSLDLTINSGAIVQRSVDAGQEFATYTPLVNSINHVCLLHDLVPIREQDLVELQCQQWFGAFMKQFIKGTAPRPTSTIQALVGSRFLPVTAWSFCWRPWSLWADSRRSFSVWWFTSMAHSLGSCITPARFPRARRLPGCLSRPALTEPDTMVSEVLLLESKLRATVRWRDMIKMSPTKMPRLPRHPRQILARLLVVFWLCRLPLPAGTSVDDIIEKYPERVHYVNILKVGLKYSNKTISESLKTHGLKLSSGVVKRINVAIDWIESEFAIDKDAFRTTYDRERRAADIPARGKDEVEDDVLEANRSKIANAMTWVKTGGLRPLPTTVTGATAASGHGTVPFKGNASIASGAGLYATPLTGPSTGPVDRGYAHGYGTGR
ncbi:unnamed protein product [Aureobasidium pullulans]|nr:unnamed protein product [Aureobasidium pullulans]